MQFLDENHSQIACVLSNEAKAFCATLKTQPPLVRPDGKVWVKTPSKTVAFLPLLDSVDRSVLLGFNGHPIIVAVPLMPLEVVSSVADGQRGGRTRAKTTGGHEIKRADHSLTRREARKEFCTRRNL